MFNNISVYLYSCNLSEQKVLLMCDVPSQVDCQLLGAFANSQEVTLSFVMSIRPSPYQPVHIEYVKDVTLLLKSRGIIRHFIRKP